MYREAPTTIELACPRCKAKLPPSDVARCTCGVWLSSFAAGVVLTDAERAPDPVTRWWRKREPCPHCSAQMVLCNPDSDPGHFQGCEGHGYWIDSDAVAHTSIADGIDNAAIERKREDETAMDAERERRFEAERERDERRREKEANEHRLAKEFAGLSGARRERDQARELDERERAARERQLANEDARQPVAGESAPYQPFALRESVDALEDRVLQLEHDKETMEIQLQRLSDRLRALETKGDE